MNPTYKIVIPKPHNFALYFHKHPNKHMLFNTIEEIKDHLEKMAFNSRVVSIDMSEYFIFDRDGRAYVINNDEELLNSDFPENLIILAK